MSKQRSPRDPWLILPVVFCMFADMALTLYFQPSGYWTDSAQVSEGNAAWEVLMRMGPWAFGGGFAVYALIIGLTLGWLRGSLQKLLGMFILLSHSYGAATWCHHNLPEKYFWAGLLGLFLVEAMMFAVYWKLRRLSRRRPRHEHG